MKKTAITLFFFCFAIFAAAGCNDDSDSGDAYNPSIDPANFSLSPMLSRINFMRRVSEKSCR